MTKKQTSLWNSNFLCLFLTNVLISFSFYTIASILSEYLVGIGISMSTAGVIVGMFSITSLVCRPFCGILADRFYNVRLICISCIMQAAGLIGFACTISTGLIIFFRILNGVGFAISATVTVCYAASFIPEERTSEGLGYFGLAVVFSSAVAPGVGIFLRDAIGMRGTFLCAGGMLVAALLLMLLCRLPETEPSYAPIRSIRIGDIFYQKSLPFTALGACFSFMNGIISTYILLFSTELGIVDISAYFSIYALLLFVIRPTLGKLMDKKGIAFTVVPGIALTSLSLVILAFSRSGAMVVLSAVVRALGQGAAHPSLQAECIRRAGKDHRGAATSTYSLGGDIGQGIGPMLGGVLLEHCPGLLGYQTLFLICAALMVAAEVYFLLINGQQKKRLARHNSIGGYCENINDG